MARKNLAVRALGDPDAREKPRYRLAIAAEIMSGTSVFAGQVENISSSGVLMRCAGADLELDAAVSIILFCPLKDRALQLRLPATVVRVEAGYVALRFGRYDSTTYTDLIDAIYCDDK